MENKKRNFLLISLLLFCSFCTFASDFQNPFPFFVTNEKYIDDLFADALNQIFSSMQIFMYYTKQIALFFFILTIMWNAFKLWFGTIEARKVAIDLVCKLILYAVLITIYPYIAGNILYHASHLGIETMQKDYKGNDLIEQGMGSLIKTMEDYIESSSQILNKALEEGKFQSLTEADVKNIAAQKMLSYEDAVTYLKKINPDFTISNPGNSTKSKINTLVAKSTASKVTNAIGNTYNAIGTGMLVSSGVAAATGAGAPVAGATLVGAAASYAGGFLYKAASKLIVYNEKESELKAAAAVKEFLNDSNQKLIFKNMAAVADFVEEKITDENGKKSNYVLATKWSSIKEKLKPYFDLPYITITSDSNPIFKNSVISPARMMSTTTLMVKLMYNKGTQEFENDTSFSLKPKQIAANFQSVIKFICLVIVLILIMLVGVGCTLQYCVTVIEYGFVTCIGYLFVSCILFDGAKSYASNLIRIFISYFAKLLVIVMISRYSIVMYMKIAARCFVESDVSSFSNIGYLLFSALLIKTLNSVAPQIASAVVSGQPSLNLGDVVRAAQSTMHGMHMAAGAGRKAAGVAASGAHLAGAGVGTIARQASNHSAINKAAEKVGGAASDAKRAELLKGKAPGATLSEAEEKQVATAGQEAARDFKRDVHQKQWSGKLNSMLDHLKFGKNGGAGQNPFGVEGMAWKAGKQDEQGRNVTQARFNEGLDEYAKKYSENEGFLPPDPKKETQDGNNNDQNTKKEGANAKETGENHGEEPK